MPIIPPTSTLQAIKNKVRRLTRAPSTAQLSEQELENYINTFVIYDFPEHLRMFNLRKTFTFYTNPYQDKYPTDIASFSGAINNPLYNFQNLYISVHPPVYMAGYQSFFTQSREQFFGVYPKVNSIASIGQIGDGITTTYTGFVNANQAILPPPLTGFQQRYTLLQNEVLFDSVDSLGMGLSLVDVPVVDPTTGNPYPVGNLYDINDPAYAAAKLNPPTAVIAANTINYATGQYTITFTNPPGAGRPINSQTVPSIMSLPQGMLYYNDTFIVRPVPDQPYRINFEVYARPTYLMDNTNNVTGTPALEEWWQYIAYGASKKIFEDRMDMDSVQLIMPEFKTQERLCLRRTIVQNTNQRVATEYTEQTQFGHGGGWGWGGGSF
jgi:hypothetical protein